MNKFNFPLFQVILFLIFVLAGFSLFAGISGFLPASTAQEILTADHPHTDHDHEEEAESDDVHEGHAHEEESALQFTAETMKEFGILTAQAGPGFITQQLETPGEIILNPDLVSHIVPRVPGVVIEINKSLGDWVHQNEVLAVLESRELAILKSHYLSALERLNLTQEIYKREEELWKKKISAEQEYLEARQKQAEAQIEVHATEQQLHAIGFSHRYLESLPVQSDTQITRYEIRAPFSGRITEKHIAFGEFVKDDVSVFTIADLSQVWGQLTLHQKDLAFVKEGQTATLRFELAGQIKDGTIAYISPILDEHTRTATARVVIDNTDGNWRPGLFINASITVKHIPVEIHAPSTAIITQDDQSAVFVQTEKGFETRSVAIGRKDKNGVEILSGLSLGQTYVSQGGFALKAEMAKEAFAHSGHSH